MNLTRINPVKSLQSLGLSSDPAQPKADITTAPELFGDPFDEYEGGDVDYGDVDALSPYILLSGDPDDEIGDSFLRKVGQGVGKAARSTGAFIKNNRTSILTGLGGAAAGAGATALIMRNRYKKQLASLREQESMQNTAYVRKSLGKINLNSYIPFFQLTGGKLNASQIDPSSKFVADTFKQMLDRQALDTPFLQETVIGTYGGGAWTAVTTGTLANRFYHGILIQFGTNVLNASPGSVVKITATMPTISGSLVIASQPFVLSYNKGYDVKMLLFPWQMVSNKPLPTLGQYSSSTPITIRVEGLPAASAVNVVVPGSLHPWTIAMRNSLLK